MVSAQQGRNVILIVEDDDAIQETLGEILFDEGYQVVGAFNGRQALEYLQAGLTPRLILLDLMMPVMSGWEFRAQQQRDPTLSGIPVVVISGDANVDAAAATLRVAGHLHKPIDISQLLETVGRYYQAGA